MRATIYLVEDEHQVDEQELGTAAKLLYHRNHQLALKILLAAKQVLSSFEENPYGEESMRLILVLDAAHFDAADDEEALRQLLRAFRDVWQGRHFTVTGVERRPALVDSDWRQNVERSFHPPATMTDHAQIAPFQSSGGRDS